MNFHERLKNTKRNDPCPCGSEKKYKKCHLQKDEEANHKELLKHQEELEAQMKEKKNDKGETEKKKDERKKDHSIFKAVPKHKMKKSEKLSNIHRRVEM